MASKPAGPWHLWGTGLKNIVANAFRWLSPTQAPNGWFWGSLLVLTMLLALPFYLLSRHESSFWPWNGGVLLSRFFFRDNYDPFHLNAEVLAFFTLLALCPWLRRPGPLRWLHRIFLLIYFTALGYQIYESVDVLLYHQQPNLANDVSFIFDGMLFLLDSLQLPFWSYPVALGLLVAVGSAIGILIAVPFRHIPLERLSRATRLGMGALALGAVVYGGHYSYALADQRMALSSLIAKIVANVTRSRLTHQQVDALSHLDPYAAYDYTSYSLITRPDIMLFFMESYGSVLYNRETFHEDFMALVQGLEERLRDGGWQSATALSVAPTWGGGSWMSYTSAMFGIRVDEQSQYLALRERYRDTPYPNLGRYLSSQGYTYLWLTPIDRELPQNILFDIERFYGADRWLTFRDLDYHGPMYSWGPSPPDQYTLGFARTFIEENLSGPVFLVFLTQNSHFPYAPVPPLVEDWRDLNDPQIDHPQPLAEPVPYRLRAQAYMEAISYDLTLLVQYILDTPSKDTIYVILGDHQPPSVSGRSDGYATLVHIISRDSAFVTSFVPYGFSEGMVPQDADPDMRHEGFYSLFVRQLLSHYGPSTGQLPPYRPEGIP